jgi:hypothetical protein
MNKLLLLVSSVSLAALPLAAGTVDYTFNTLDYAGSVATAIYGVNDSGTVTGYEVAVAGGAKTAIYGTPASLATMPNAAGCTAGIAAGINDSGSIVGVGTCSGLGKSFLTTNNGTTYTLFNPPAGTGGTASVSASQASGINSSGTVAGYFHAS